MDDARKSKYKSPEPSFQKFYYGRAPGGCAYYQPMELSVTIIINPSCRGYSCRQLRCIEII